MKIIVEILLRAATLNIDVYCHYEMKKMILLRRAYGLIRAYAADARQIYSITAISHTMPIGHWQYLLLRLILALRYEALLTRLRWPVTATSLPRWPQRHVTWGSIIHCCYAIRLRYDDGCRHA